MDRNRWCGLAALLTACGSGENMESANIDWIEVRDSEQVYSLTTVQMLPNGTSETIKVPITARQQKAMIERRKVLSQLSPAANSKAVTARDSNDAATSVQEIYHDFGCDWDSLWVFNGPNLTGDQVCFADRGQTSLTPFGLVGQVRSLWGSGFYGGSISTGHYPRGQCVNNCVAWNAAQVLNSVSCSSTYSQLEQGRWGTSCWLQSSAYTNNDPHDYPKNEEYDWTEELQGITSDKSAYWYITQLNVIRQVPLSQNLHANLNGYPTRGFTVEEFGLGYDHFGDLDHFGGMLYVPLEDHSGGTGTGPGVAYRQANSMMVGYNVAPLTAQIQASWCAINPVDGLLYSSDYNTGLLQRYTRSFYAGSLYLTHHSTVQLKTPVGAATSLRRIQGGAFSPNGKLYLVSWHETAALGGIYGFDPEDGRQRTFQNVMYRYGHFGDNQELEGLEIHNLDSSTAPGIGGQFHLLMIDLDLDDDNVYFKHMRISDVSKL